MDQRPLILIVEDEKDNQELLTIQLSMFNLSYICTDNGLTALEMVQTHQPDLILLDIMLPDFSGIQVISFLKQNPKTARIPIIAVTALAMAEDRDRMLLAGSDDYISKPYDLDELETVIHRHLSKSRSLISPLE